MTSLAVLRSNLASPDAEVRRRAVQALAGARDPSAADLVLAALADGDWRVRRQAAFALRDMSPSEHVLFRLIDALRSADDIGMRNAVVEALGELGQRAVSAIGAALPRLDPERMKLAADALGATRERSALDLLSGLMRSSEPNVRVAAVEAVRRLGEHHPGPARERLLAALEEKGLDTMGDYGRLVLLEALHELGAELAWERLSALAEDPILGPVACEMAARSTAPEVPSLLMTRVLDRSGALVARVARALASYLDADEQRRQFGRAAYERMADTVAGLEGTVVEVVSSAHEPFELRRAALMIAVGLAFETAEPLASEALGEEALAQAAARALGRVAPAPSALPEPRGSQARWPAAEQRVPQRLRRTAPTLDRERFRALRDRINSTAGLHFADDALPLLERQLGERLACLGISSFADYLHYLETSDPLGVEMDAAIDSVTVKETYFFRQEYQLRSFAAEVLPALQQRCSTTRRLTLWSGGCASGEEAYTLAMLVVASRLFEGWDVRILGTDISRTAIADARRGTYRESALRTTSADMRSRFFRPSDAAWQVLESVKQICHFGRQNLLADAGTTTIGSVDAVFCRNVLIYLDVRSRRRVVDNIYQHLVPGGYLLLGHSESLLNLSTAFELAHLKEDLAYRKPVSERVGRTSDV